MNNENDILRTFFLFLVIGFIISAITLHPDKAGKKTMWEYYMRFGMLLANGCISGLGSMLGHACYYYVKNKFKK